MRTQYEEYNYKLKLQNIKIDEEEKQKFDIFDKNKIIKKKYEEWKKQNEHFNLKDGMRKFLQEEKTDAETYMKEKKNNAFLYQIQSSLEKLDTDEAQQSIQSEDTLAEDQSISIFHCVKYVNGGKLSSHLWFFSGFCELFQPAFTVLLDCGLVPEEEALYNMYLAFETDQHIGGACGFMGIKLQDVYTDAGQRKDDYKNAQPHVDILSDMFQKIFCIQKAQMYEYNMGHFIDKPFESLFGYIQVLPGAFSGYRWNALKRDQETGDCILDDYLASVLDQTRELTLEQQNMNLAEDRILCLKIYSKHKRKYTLKYLPNCRAKVDPVTDLMTLISQRSKYYYLKFNQNITLISNRKVDKWFNICFETCKLFKILIYKTLYLSLIFIIRIISQIYLKIPN